MRTRVALCVTMLVASGRFVAAGPTVRAEGDRHELCGAEDLPETGLQGDVPRADQESGRAELGYNCGLALVGHATLDADGEEGPSRGSRPPHAGAGGSTPAVRHPDGRPGRDGTTIPASAWSSPIPTEAVYCTVGPLGGQT